MTTFARVFCLVVVLVRSYRSEVPMRRFREQVLYCAAAILLLSVLHFPGPATHELSSVFNLNLPLKTLYHNNFDKSKAKYPFC